MFGQDDWILVSFLFYIFWIETSSQSLKTQNKKQKKKLGQYPAILTSRLVNKHMNIFHADTYKSGKGRKYKKIYFRARNLSDV